MSVYLLATLDTKGMEAALVRDRLMALGVEVTTVDTGCLGEPAFEADVSREEVFRAAGSTVSQLASDRDRGAAVAQAAEGVARLVQEAYERGEVSGVLGLGGSAGTTISTQAMRQLPIGVPKLAVSTLASGQVRPYVGEKDILMLNSVVDIAGINRISRSVLESAAHAMAGMVLHRQDSTGQSDRPIIAATMFGVTTPCVQHARSLLEEAGYEVLVFHATGNGGLAMESLISDGLIAGVLDLTTTELADELVGGVLSAGPQRLTAAAAAGVPQVVSVGATDMVNFGPPETVPEQFRERKFYEHNASVTLMRTTAAECRQIGQDIGSKVSQARGPAQVLVPLRGVSAIDSQGQPFEDTAARSELFAALREHTVGVPLVEMDHHINDTEFAAEAARRLLEMIQQEPADGNL